MTRNQNQQTQAIAATATSDQLGERLARWIQDPFASAIAATVATSCAVGFVLSGMWLVNLGLG